MINELVLTNFKKHESFTATFKEGLVAIKGANEGGKSTIYHAVLYAFFGSRALPMSLADTVTYDKPESSLKVKLVFTFEDAQYTIVRSKSGATLTSPYGTASGQAEVTKYVEGLLGVTADSATKLMIASQSGLRGALESNEAVALIEKLANLDLIDELIKDIQTRLPSGNTKTIADALVRAEEIVADVPQEDWDTEQAAVDLASAAVDDRQQALNAIKAVLPPAEAVTAAQNVVRQSQIDATRRETIAAQITALHARTGERPVAPTVANIQQLRADWEQEKEAAALRKLYKEFAAVEQPAPIVCTDTRKELLAKINLEESVKAAATTRKAVAQASKIVETACGLCGKDLSEVPEVVAKNAKLDGDIAQAEATLAASDAHLSALRTRFSRVVDAENIVDEAKKLWAKYHKHTVLSEDGMTVTWTTPVEPTPAVSLDYAALIANSEALTRNYLNDLATYENNLKSLEFLNADLASLVIDREAVDRAVAVLETYNRNKEALAAADKALTSASSTLDQNLLLLQNKKNLYVAKKQQWEKAVAEKEKLHQDLVEMQTHNNLIKRLREVRPQVAARLWNVVLAAVSLHFSTIRGTQSIVTRDADGFKVDGRPVQGLSGSTLDSLGLAIRVALNKTFLPSIQFLMLDEPASGMDDNREAAMLGLLSSLDYKQVLVITHSSLADSHCSDIVQL